MFARLIREKPERATILPEGKTARGKTCTTSDPNVCNFWLRGGFARGKEQQEAITEVVSQINGRAGKGPFRTVLLNPAREKQI